MLSLIRMLMAFVFGLLYAVTHPTSVRNSVATLILGLLDTGAGSPSNGLLVFQAAGSPDILATLQFSVPAFGAPSAGVATANAITACPSCMGGTVTTFELRNSSNQTVVLGSVTATGGGGDITLNSVALSLGQQVSMTSLTYTAMA